MSEEKKRQDNTKKARVKTYGEIIKSVTNNPANREYYLAWFYHEYIGKRKEWR